MNAQTTIHDGGVLRASLAFSVVILFGMGLSYSLAGTGLGRLLFAQQATGSMIERDGHVVGSALVAQGFADPRYFMPRPSAAGYDPMAVAGSNQARSNPELRARIAEATAAVAQREGVALSAVPADLVTQSGGGLDPHISVEAAKVQAARVAKVRGLDPATVAELVKRHTEAPQFGLLGQPRVNVLELNLALDAL